MGMGFDVVNIGLASTPTTELAVTMWMESRLRDVERAVQAPMELISIPVIMCWWRIARLSAMMTASVSNREEMRMATVWDVHVIISRYRTVRFMPDLA